MDCWGPQPPPQLPPPTLIWLPDTGRPPTSKRLVPIVRLRWGKLRAIPAELHHFAVFGAHGVRLSHGVFHVGGVSGRPFTGDRSAGTEGLCAPMDPEHTLTAEERDRLRPSTRRFRRPFSGPRTDQLVGAPG